MFEGFFGGSDPFKDLFTMSQELEKALGQMGMFGKGFEAAKAFQPKVEMYETPDELIVKAEMPGFDKDSIDVRVRGRYLIIKGTKKQEEEKKEEKNTLYSESFYGEVQRVIPLPMDVKQEGIEATYDKGILEVRLPKTEAERKEVKIIVKEPEEKKKEEGNK
ncbi:MAG: Hsp20 family protein [Nitrospiraceae bacterium]|nr:Hsp20 family protein [Nitrospiraceae bacterium]